MNPHSESLQTPRGFRMGRVADSRFIRGNFHAATCGSNPRACKLENPNDFIWGTFWTAGGALLHIVRTPLLEYSQEAEQHLDECT